MCCEKVTMKITKRKILLGCLGMIVLSCCLYFVLAIIIVYTTEWDTVVKDNMHDPEFRQGVEKWLDIEFPASVEWEGSEYRVWQDQIFHCVFTLLQKDVDVMFPPENTAWCENDHDMLNHHSVGDWRAWLKGKNMDHFKIMEFSPKPKSHGIVVVDHPPGINENQRVWVYINCVCRPSEQSLRVENGSIVQTYD